MTNYYNSPIGFLELSVSDNALQSINFLADNTERNQSVANEVLHQTVAELSEYFDGNRKKFSIPLNPYGTDFQKSVWKILREIPYGQTITYGELATKLGDHNKVRAVGKANGNNPIPIIIPCHRVVGADNNLIGYAGGITRKKYLLKHEGAVLL
jgi:methylated-DNA-[protein]-cysteine S-methyltransferase